MLYTLAVFAWHMLLHCKVCYPIVYRMQHAVTLRGKVLQHIPVCGVARSYVAQHMWSTVSHRYCRCRG